MGTSLHCPTCRRQIEWSDRYPCRPFCSERCRLIDLGAWFSEQRAVPGESESAAGEVREDGAPED
jgi:endogenous inhibitor of DNA gyrase (YacG/DUF329 family)